jgi:hypothetical protein
MRGRPSSSRCSTAAEVVTLIAVTQEQVRDWWNRNSVARDRREWAVETTLARLSAFGHQLAATGAKPA